MCTIYAYVYNIRVYVYNIHVYVYNIRGDTRSLLPTY
jgi:hypothetical protein